MQTQDNDAWKGSITVKINDVEQKLNCDKCSGSSFEYEVVVDGNGDSTNQAQTHCLNGTYCTFTIFGKIS